LTNRLTHRIWRVGLNFVNNLDRRVRIKPLDVREQKMAFEGIRGPKPKPASIDHLESPSKPIRSAFAF
jgi:hypothetical protein